MCWIHGGYIAGWASKPICLLPKVQHSWLCPQISWDTPNPLADHVKKKMPIGHWVEPILRPNDQIIHEISHYFRNINHLYIDDHIWSPCLSFLFCQLSTFVTRRQLSASSETCPQLRASPHRVPLIMSLRIQRSDGKGSGRHFEAGWHIVYVGSSTRWCPQDSVQLVNITMITIVYDTY